MQMMCMWMEGADFLMMCMWMEGDSLVLIGLGVSPPQPEKVADRHIELLAHLRLPGP